MDTDESLKVGRSNCWKSWALDEERASKWGRNRREGKARTDKCFDSCYFHHFNTETHDPKASDCHSSGVSCSEGCFSLTPFPSLALLLSLSGRVCVCVCACVRTRKERKTLTLASDKAGHKRTKHISRKYYSTFTLITATSKFPQRGLLKKFMERKHSISPLMLVRTIAETISPLDKAE